MSLIAGVFQLLQARQDIIVNASREGQPSAFRARRLA